MSDGNGLLNLSDEAKAQLAARSEAKARFAKAQAEIELIRAEIEAIDATMMSNGIVTQDMIDHW